MAVWEALVPLVELLLLMVLLLMVLLLMVLMLALVAGAGADCVVARMLLNCGALYATVDGI